MRMTRATFCIHAYINHLAVLTFMAVGEKWSYDETLLAFRLYFKNGKPLGKQDVETIALANAIGRSTGSVSAKMYNIESSNPTFEGNGRKGLSHGSADLPVLWDKFRPENLIDTLAECDVIYKKYYRKDCPAYSCQPEFLDAGVAARTDCASVGVTVNELGSKELYRAFILNKWGGKCCLTGIKEPQLISGYYLRPWEKCDNAQKMDPYNGICLNKFHGGIFEDHKMSITPDNEIVYAPDLENAVGKDVFDRYFAEFEFKKLRFSNESHYRPYLNYHYRQFCINNNVENIA